MFSSYLTYRKQAVYCNGNQSPLENIGRGVPQGSILGPLLFLVYINDIVNASGKFSFVIFADDTNLLMSHKSIVSLHENANVELEKISRWVLANDLSINVKKTNYVLFQSRSVSIDFDPIILQGCELERVSHTKFLGVIIGENLNWKKHIQSV